MLEVYIMGFRGDGVCLAFHLTSSVLAQFLLSSCLHGLSLVCCLLVDPIAFSKLSSLIPSLNLSLHLTQKGQGA